jgi:hypothetical protein
VTSHRIGLPHERPYMKLACQSLNSHSLPLIMQVLNACAILQTLQADLIPQLSGVLMMQPLARTATNAAYCASACGDAASEEYRIHLQTKDGASGQLEKLLCRGNAHIWHLSSRYF